MRYWRRVARALAIACVAGCGSSSGAVKAPIVDAPMVVVLTPESARIGLRSSVVADQYFWLRAKALEGEIDPGFGDSLAAMRELRGELSSDPTAWEDLEVPLGSATGASDLLRAYASLPVTREVGGKVVALRALATRLARTMEATEMAYRRGPYRAHAVEIAAAAKELQGRLLPKEEAIMAAITADMALPNLDRPIVLTLVGDAPYPGIFAADARGRTMASFVRVRGLDGGALFETVLHESLHAIDEFTVREPTGMNMLRSALGRRGIDESDPNLEMAVNTLTAAEAASLVRRFADPGHRPLGESGFYALFPPAPAIVAAWDRHLAGEPIDTTADAIARAVAAP